MIVEGKVWGRTRLLHSVPNVFEAHVIAVDKNRTCSEHKHIHKYNLFYVYKGILEIKIWKPAQSHMIDITILRVGEGTIVEPGQYHQFRAITDCEALEIYWSEWSPLDIVRRERADK